MGTFICHDSHDYLCKGITMIMKLSMNNNWISRIPISEIVKQECHGSLWKKCLQFYKKIPMF